MKTQRHPAVYFIWAILGLLVVSLFVGSLFVACECARRYKTTLIDIPPMTIVVLGRVGYASAVSAGKSARPNSQAAQRPRTNLFPKPETDQPESPNIFEANALRSRIGLGSLHLSAAAIPITRFPVGACGHAELGGGAFGRRTANFSHHV